MASWGMGRPTPAPHPSRSAESPTPPPSPPATTTRVRAVAVAGEVGNHERVAPREGRSHVEPRARLVPSSVQEHEHGARSPRENRLGPDGRPDDELLESGSAKRPPRSPRPHLERALDEQPSHEKTSDDEQSKKHGPRDPPCRHATSSWLLTRYRGPTG